MPNFAICVYACCFALGAAPVLAQQTVELAPAACGAAPPPDILFANGFDVPQAAPSSPSNGSGGGYPGPWDRSIVLDGVTKPYYVYVPSSYDPARAAPVMLVLHGAQPNEYYKDVAAQALRIDWSLAANAGGFIVLSAVGSGLYSWNGTDYAALAAVLADLESAYNVERTRIYLWGFSAGGHFGHDVVLQDRGRFAAYGVGAGRLTAWACDTSARPAPSCSTLLAAHPRHVPVHIQIGTSDPGRAATAQDVVRFGTAGWVEPEIRYVEFDGGHEYRLEHFTQVWSYVCRYAVAP